MQAGHVCVAGIAPTDAAGAARTAQRSAPASRASAHPHLLPEGGGWHGGWFWQAVAHGSHNAKAAATGL